MASAKIIIPCYNEADRLEVTAFKHFKCQPHDVTFLFVNDGSKDETSQVVADLASSDSTRFSVLHFKENAGKAEAVRQGMLAVKCEKIDYVGYWDADLATPLDTIGAFIDLAESRPGLQMIMGSRVKLLGRKIERHVARHYVGRVFATTVSVILGLAVYDTQCGAKLFRACSSMYRVFSEPFLSRWIFDVEILARLIQSRRKTDLPQAKDIIYEFPLMEWRDVPGSKLRYSDFARAVWELYRIHSCYF